MPCSSCCGGTGPGTAEVRVIDPMTGQLWWTWRKNMIGEELARTWGPGGGVGHRRLGVGTGPTALPGCGDAGHRGSRVVQLPYAPELHRAERSFRELCRALEGRVCPVPQAQQEVLEPILKAWQSQAGTATVWLALIPEDPDGPARRPSSNPSMMEANQNPGADIGNRSVRRATWYRMPWFTKGRGGHAAARGRFGPGKHRYSRIRPLST
jgi:hypothetical protein